MKIGNKYIKACFILAAIGFYTSAVICFVLEIYTMAIINFALGTVFLGIHNIYINKCLKKIKAENKNENEKTKESK